MLCGFKVAIKRLIMSALLADRVAGTVSTLIGRSSSIELILASLTVRSVGVLLAVRTVSTVTGLTMHLLVEVAPV